MDRDALADQTPALGRTDGLIPEGEERGQNFDDYPSSFPQFILEKWGRGVSIES